MNKILKEYNYETLLKLHNENKLSTLPGVGETTKKKLINYINNNDDIFNRIKYKFKEQEEILSPLIYEINEKNEKDNSNGLYEVIFFDKNEFEELYNWSSKLTITDNDQFKLIKMWLEKNNKPSNKEIEEDPMILNHYISFKILDNMALKNNWWQEGDYYRHECYLNYIIETVIEKYGNTYITKKDLDLKLKEFKNTIDINKINNIIKQSENISYNDKEKFYYIQEYFNYENKVYEYINYFKGLNNHTIPNIKKEDLTDEQLDGLKNIFSNSISCIIGPGGTGKTSKVLKTACKYIDVSKIVFCAPTHASKKRGMEDLDKDIKGYTIQKLIYKPPCSNNEIDIELNKLFRNYDINYIFIDESSMIDIKVFYKFIKICYKYSNSNKLHIVFLGDNNQLPPVGAGCPFNDIINYVSTTRLTKNFRTSSKDLNNFYSTILKEDDSWGIYKESNKKYNNIHFKTGKAENGSYIPIIESILINFKEEGYIPYNGNDRVKNFQFITHANDTCEKIHKIIRNIFYRPSDKLYDIDDLILFTTNDKERFINNGDIGFITNINKGEYNKDIYDITKLEDGRILKNIKRDIIKSAWARTVHNSQGLQFNKVIYYLNGRSPIYTSNLHYTAYSRTKEDLYLTGDLWAYDVHKKSERNTYLKLLIEDKLPPEISFVGNNIISRKTIPKKLRWDVWFKRNSGLEGKCYVCNNHLEFINFECGHVISLKDDGDTSLKNLEPICGPCNKAMGSENLETYKNNYYN